MGDRAGGCCSLSLPVSEWQSPHPAPLAHWSWDMGGIFASSETPRTPDPAFVPSLATPGTPWLFLWMGGKSLQDREVQLLTPWLREGCCDEFVEFCPISKLLKLLKLSHTPSWELPAKPNWFWFSGLSRKRSSGLRALAQKPGRELEIGSLELSPMACRPLPADAREFWRVGLAAELFRAPHPLV